MEIKRLPVPDKWFASGENTMLSGHGCPSENQLENNLRVAQALLATKRFYSKADKQIRTEVNFNLIRLKRR